MANEHLFLIKQRYPRAYEKWTADEETLLKQKHAEGVGIDELAALFQRQPGAITSRIAKLRFGSIQDDLKPSSIDVKVSFEWETVYQSETTEYEFPAPITRFMNDTYRKPMVYRWIIELPDAEETLIYIGESARFCPDRLSGYLAPGPTQQTNIRLHRQFNEFVENGGKVKLQALKVNGAIVNDLELTEKDMGRQDIRRLIERLLVTLYRSQGANLLNL
jgi:hypothetical protein